LNRKRGVLFFAIGFGLLVLTVSVYFLLLPKKSEQKILLSLPVKRADPGIVKPPHDTTQLECIHYALEKLAGSDSMRHATFGFCLAGADSGTIVLGWNAGQTFIPASVLKIVTTGLCLRKLGPGFRYSTRLQYDGAVDVLDKVLEGNVYIKGSGDPTLGSSNFADCKEDKVLEDWVLAIKKMGIEKIDGAVVGDGDVFDEDQIPSGWAWEDMQSEYAIGSSGLSFRENCYDICLSGRSGIPEFKIPQQVPGLKLTNHVQFNRSELKDYAYVSGGPYMNERELKGQVKAGNCQLLTQSALPDPAYYCANMLYEILKKNGISVRDSSTTTRRLKLSGKKTKKERITFYTTYSPSLDRIVWYTNTVSQNFYTENLLRTLSLYEHGYGSTPGGVNVVRDFMDEQEIDPGGFYMADGSGVSRFDGITPEQLVGLLHAFTRDSMSFKSFYNSLPAFENSIRYKGGYMTRVLSYAGYVTTAGGKRLSFALLANNHSYSVIGMKNELDIIMRMLTELD